MDQGISVYDSDFRLMAFNRRFAEMMNIPLNRFRIGDRFEDYLRMVAESGAYGPGPVEQYVQGRMDFARRLEPQRFQRKQPRSEEHTSELQSLLRTSYAVFCLQ